LSDFFIAKALSQDNQERQK